MNSITTYLATLQANLTAGNATEHTHRAALQTLLQSFLLNHRITNEPRRIACGSPDFEVATGQVPIGHIEAKNIGIDLNEALKSEQLQRYLPSLNNLIVTDYLEFRWFINGIGQPDMTVILATVNKNNNLQPIAENFERFASLLKTFAETQIITLDSPGALAEKMAHIAKQIKYSISLAYADEGKDETAKIHSQLNGFREVLISTLSRNEFADMVAQTICYGLFSAKCYSLDQPLVRENANHFIPKTNPFLRQFFNQLAGIDLDERLVWAVEHLIAVLNRTDMGAILASFGKHTHKEDPVIHFYETFLSHYDPKLREVRGVYYTPEPVVSYIVRSVDLILRNQFNLRDGLADNSKINEVTHKVQILDPATGTGTFLHSVIAIIYEKFSKNKGMWSNYVSQHLLPRVHGFELLMAAYTVAHIKLSLQLKDYGYDFASNERLRVFLTNTLDEAHGHQQTLLSEWLSNEANAANEIKSNSPVMVIIGNPPYSGHSANPVKWIKDLLHGNNGNVGKIANYFEIDDEPLNESNSKWLNNDYVKFIRFAQWRIMQTGYGVLAFITSNSYLDSPTFRGMRQALMQDFDDIYILDLHGNSKKKELSPDGSVDKNVFDIKEGVAIGIFVRTGKATTSIARVHHAHLYGIRAAKYQYLLENSLKTTQWTELRPQSPFYLFVPQNTDLFPEYQQGWKITDVMTVNVLGFQTHRDYFAIAFEKQTMINRIRDMKDTELSDTQIIDKYSLIENDSWKVDKTRKSLRDLKDWENKIITCLYRPFDNRYCYFSEIIIDRTRRELQYHVFDRDNLCLNTVRQTKASSWQHALASKFPTSALCVEIKEGSTVFPLYLYPLEKDEFINGNGNGHKKEIVRKPNFSDEFIADLETHLKLQFISEDRGDFEKTISALDVFSYIYAVFHSPTYRNRYAEFLKMDFPRLPLIQDKEVFKQLSELGKQLISIHLMNAHIESNCCFPIKGSNIVEKVDFKDNKIYINKTQYFDNVKLSVWEFYIGGYQVCQKWLKDRKGRVLNYDDCTHYLYILAALEQTQSLMSQIDNTLLFPI